MVQVGHSFGGSVIQKVAEAMPNLFFGDQPLEAKIV